MRQAMITAGLINTDMNPVAVRLSLCVVILYVALLPLLPYGAITAHDCARLAQIPVIVLCSFCLAMNTWNTSGPGADGLGVASLLLVLAAASAGAAAVPSMAYREVALLIGLAVVAATVAQSVRSGGESPWAQGIVLAAAMYAALFLVLTLATMASGLPPSNVHLIRGFDNPRFLNHVQTVAMPLLAGVVGMQSQRRPWRIAAGSALVIHGVMLIFTLGRATMLSLTVATVLVFVLFGKSGRQLAYRLLLSALVAIVLHYALFQLLADMAEVPMEDAINAYANPTGDHSRLYLWRIAVDQIGNAPWLGIGPMHFAHTPNLKGAHPHSAYLQFAAEFGLPATLALLACLGRFMWLGAQRLRRAVQLKGSSEFGVAAWLAGVAALVDAGFSGNMVMPVSQIWVAMAFGLLMGRADERPGRPSLMVSRNLSRTGLVAFIVLAAWLSAVTGIEWRRLSAVPAPASAFSIEAVGTTLRPRFWLDGWF